MAVQLVDFYADWCGPCVVMKPVVEELVNELKGKVEDVDIRQSSLWARYLEEFGWSSEKISTESFAYIKKVPFLGSLIKIPRLPVPVPFKKIDSIAKKHNAVFVKLEPEIETTDSSSKKILGLLQDNGFRKDGWALNSTKTFNIDLTKNEAELLKNMEKDTRYNVRLAIRKGVIVRETNDLEQFKTLYFDTAKRKKFWPAKKELEALWKVFSRNGSAAILTAFSNNQPVASTLLLYGNKSALYYHAASLEKYREVMAPYLLLWESMKFAKSKGSTVFDLEGIKDPRYRATKRWGGFTLFKKGFGGRDVEYLGSFTKYYKLWAKILFFFSRF